MSKNPEPRFVTTTTMRHYRPQGIEIELEIHPQVFPPSPMGATYAEQLRVSPGDRVMDVGTGSGLLAVLAARLGGRVSASDVAREAVELAAANARRNGVAIEVHQGPFFADASGPFDVIVANLPQAVVPSSTLASLGEALGNAIDGGEGGDDLVLELLEQARHYMLPTSRLMLSIDTEADYRRSMARMLEHYEPTLRSFKSLPLAGYVEEHRDWYLDLSRRGRLTVFEENGDWKCHQMFFELRLK